MDGATAPPRLDGILSRTKYTQEGLGKSAWVRTFKLWVTQGASGRSAWEGWVEVASRAAMRELRPCCRAAQQPLEVLEIKELQLECSQSEDKEAQSWTRRKGGARIG